MTLFLFFVNAVCHMIKMLVIAAMGAAYFYHIAVVLHSMKGTRMHNGLMLTMRTDYKYIPDKFVERCSICVFRP